MTDRDGQPNNISSLIKKWLQDSGERFLGILLLIISITAIIVSVVLLLSGSDLLHPFVFVVLGVTSTFIVDRLFYKLFDPPERIQVQVREAQAKAAKEPDKAKPAWDLATAKLEVYLNTNIAQIRWIFVLSVFVMFAGFLLLGAATILALQSPNEATPAIITGIGGVITEFIGATFLFLYRSAIEHSSQYIMTLDKTSSVGVAIQILDNIKVDESDSDSVAKITQAKIEVAKLLLGHKES